MAALTDQAIAKIKDLIMSGEFAAGSKLPKEQELAQRLGLSRNSLREAVRALTLIGVLEPRVGDGTYVTSLEPELLLDRHGVRQRPADRTDAARAAPGAADPRARRDRHGGDAADDDDFAALESCLAEMDAAETTQAFIDADEEFHRIIVIAVGQRDARLADPEPLRRDAACAPLALDHRAGRRRDRRRSATRHLPRRCATATPSSPAPPT